MDWKVVKLGGSVLKDISDINKAAELIGQKYSTPLVVVVSAVNGITDFLQDGYLKIQRGEISPEKFIAKLKKRNFVGLPAEKEISEKINTTLNLNPEDAGKKSREEFLSLGEKISACLLDLYLKKQGLNSKILWPEEFGLFVGEKGSEIFVDLEKTRVNCARHFSKDKILIIPGFYGIDEKNKIRLLGRGGSDYSATALGYCLKASRVDLWKNVAGVLSGPPDYLEKTKPVKRLSFEEAEELAGYGAGVLHPKTVEPAREGNFPVFLYDFPLGQEPATVIYGEKGEGEGIKSLAFSGRFSVLKITGNWQDGETEIFKKLLICLEKEKIEINSFHICPGSAALLLNKEMAPKAKEVILSAGIDRVLRVECIEETGLIALVGEGLGEKCCIAARALSILSVGEIPVRFVSAGISPVSMLIVVDAKQLKKALKIVHQEVIQKGVEKNEKELVSNKQKD